MAYQFAKVPIEALNDKRLSPSEFKVLVTLLSFADASNKAWPKREAISERCGIALPHISRATAALVRLGWLEKSGNGGFRCSNHYRIKLPFTRTDSEQVNGETRTDSDTKTRTDSVRRKEQTIELTNEQTNARTARVPAWMTKALQAPLPEWIKPHQWQAFVEHRHELKARLTSQGIARTIAQLDHMRQAGQPPAKVIEQSILKGWTGLFDLAQTRTRAPTNPGEINSLIAQGERVGVYPQPGESTQDFASRIQHEAGARIH